MYAQDTRNYTWVETINYAVDIPKDKWYPLSFPLTQSYISNRGFDIVNGQINITGIQVFPTDSAWSGAIYVDSLTLVGNKLAVIDGFGTQTDLSKYMITTPVHNIDSITAATASDTNGVTHRAMAVWIDLDTTSAGGYGSWFGWNNFKEASVVSDAFYYALAIWIYIPLTDTIPSGVDFQLFGQPVTNGYPWRVITDNVQAQIPKGVWYPIYWPLKALSIGDSAKFYLAGDGSMDINQFGIQVGNWGAPKRPWKSVIYVTDVELVGHSTAPPPPVWLAADFKTKGTGVINGLNGFKTPSFATTGTITSFTDLINGGVYTLKGSMTLSKLTQVFAAVRDSVPMMDTSSDKATGVSLNILLPSVMPSHGVVQLYVSGGANDSAAVVDTIGSQIKTGSWTKLMISGLDVLTTSGKFNPALPAEIGVVVHYPAPYDTTIWAGNIEIDSVNVYGISFSKRLSDENNMTTGVEATNSHVPKVYQLYSNYPNPFNPTTIVQYDLPRASKVVLKVYDALG